MFSLRIILVSTGVFALTACAAPTTQSSSAPKSMTNVTSSAETSPMEPTPMPDDQVVERKVCKKVNITGTRFPKLVCLTEQEWKEVSERAQDDLNRVIMDEQGLSTSRE